MRALPLRNKDPYTLVRLKLFGIHFGALLSVWVILLLVVYSLMSQQLFQVLDDELRYSAIRIIHGYNTQQKIYSFPIALGDLQITFSLWHIFHQHTEWTAAFIDGNPFVNVKSMYTLALNAPNGIYNTISIEGISYRAFYAIVHTERGTYLIRVIRAAGPTTATLSRLLWTLGIAGITAFGLSLLLGLWLTSRSLAPMIASWQRQQQFVADASHELRTPLAIIKTNLDVLFRHPEHTINSEMHFLANAYSEVTRTSSLIDGLLTLARVDSQEQLIEVQQVDMSGLILEVADTLELLAEDQGIDLQVMIPSAPCKTLGDLSRLRQLLLILIDNALRYAGAGSIVTISATSDTLHTVLTVADTGAGIDSALLPRIFDRFVRGDATRHRHEQGGGLGLSIAKWIVDAHNGTITVSSYPGKGTTFTITLPS